MPVRRRPVKSNRPGMPLEANSMFSRLKNSLLFRLEQTMVRGPAARFALLLTLVVLVATVAGLLARALESAVDAIWWAFLRLTDPGDLGDDQGVAKATISTAARNRSRRPRKRLTQPSSIEVDLMDPPASAQAPG